MFKKIQRISAISAGLIAAGYLSAVALAQTDGPDTGLEIPSDVSLVAIATATLLTSTALVGWLIDLGLKASAERDIHYIVATELEKQLAKLVDERGPLMQALDRRSAARNQAMKKAVKAEVTAALDDAVSAGYRAAIVGAAAQAANATPNATVTRLPTRGEEN